MTGKWFCGCLPGLPYCLAAQESGSRSYDSLFIPEGGNSTHFERNTIRTGWSGCG